jgi:DNA polymerase-3 subunit alpha
MEVLPEFFKAIKTYNPVFVGHNIEFDINVMQSELSRLNYAEKFFPSNRICTMRSSTNYCKLPSNKPGYYKWPNLGELYMKLFGKSFDNAHHAHDDVKATAECFFRLIELNVVKP